MTRQAAAVTGRSESSELRPDDLSHAVATLASVSTRAPHREGRGSRPDPVLSHRHGTVPRSNSEPCDANA